MCRKMCVQQASVCTPWRSLLEVHSPTCFREWCVSVFPLAREQSSVVIPVGNMKGTPPRGSVGIAWQLLQKTEFARTASTTGEAATVKVAVQKIAKKVTGTAAVRHAKRGVWSVGVQAEGTVVPRENNDDQVDNVTKKLAQQEAGAAEDAKG